MENLLYWIWLSIIPDVGNKKMVQLIKDFGSPVNIWMASQNDLKSHQLLNETIIHDILDKNKKLEAESQLKNLYKNNIKAVTINEEKYPSYLKNIFDPPAILYYKGDLKRENKTIAVVGSRRASDYGLKMAESISYELGALGITIVSGMARGVDSYAHYGAIKANGRTIAVLGCGLDTVYPPENKDLMEKIAGSGTVISEYLPGMPPIPKNFPARNRIISGLSLGVVIVEA
ncbi:MAG: DNA-processing protein DprA, partial [Bacteroidota bacterium]|nr:DNA-processing protein DprA [Bacteroidota bacterium]